MLQALHGCCERAVKAAVIPGSGLEWARHYQQHVESDRSCLNEWEVLNELESVRKDSEGYRLVKPAVSVVFRDVHASKCSFDLKKNFNFAIYLTKSVFKNLLKVLFKLSCYRWLFKLNINRMNVEG